jgi:acyl-CoA synthetase (AMP-forming)/AMP-acid ligase II
VNAVLAAVRDAVARFPDADALRTADSAVTYREFGARVEDLAGRLGPGGFVGIDGTRGPGAVVAMVAAWAAGRPFVVLDPRDSEASNRAKLDLLGVRVVVRDGDPVEVGPGRPGPAVEDLAYAIRTSGSTGEPKCVLVRAAPLAAVVRDHVERLEVGPGCATLQFARLTFDGCITEIFWTLTSGATLVVLDETRLAPGAALAGTLERFGVTHLKTTPFALSATEPTPAMRLRHVVNGGGACRPAVLRRWAAAAAFHNAYGLTETTVCNLITPPLDPAAHRDAVPLGEPVGDCGLHLREDGELVVTGASVAAGYLTPDGLRSFGTEYRTGDVVARRGGELYYVERLDRQVKVRGYRLDPGEVEAAVCRLERVSDAVVVAEAHEGSATAEKDALVCYYRGDAGPREVREHLEGLLDPYKVPSVFERVDAFPHTPNGKVDRDALAARRHARAAAGTPDLLHLARTLTGVGDVGLDDNFFDVGGDSASAVVLVSKMKEWGWVDAGVRDVLRAESLRELAEALAERSG